MDEPPAKRARRTDNSGVREKSERAAASTETEFQQSSKSSNKHGHRSSRHGDVDDHNHRSRRDADTRKRSRSPRGDSRKVRERSPRDRDRTRHDRDGRNSRDEGKEQVRRDKRKRSRSRDRERERENEAKKGRGRQDDRDHDRSRSRSSSRSLSRTRSPRRNGTSYTNHEQPRRSHHSTDGSAVDTKPRTNQPPSGPRQTNGASSRHNQTAARMQDTAMEDAGSKPRLDPSDPDYMLQRMMGFSTFKSTQNTKVPGNQIYAVRKEKKTEYRQYMNRQGGFNRPLSPG